MIFVTYVTIGIIALCFAHSVNWIGEEATTILGVFCVPLLSFVGLFFTDMWIDKRKGKGLWPPRFEQTRGSHGQLSNYAFLTDPNVITEIKEGFLFQHAILVSRDQTGTLYEVGEGSSRFLVVVVKNSTPDDNGRQKLSFLPVDTECRPLLANGGKGNPQARTARNAVASTFGLYGEDYRPVIET